MSSSLSSSSLAVLQPFPLLLLLNHHHQLQRRRQSRNRKNLNATEVMARHGAPRPIERMKTASRPRKIQFGSAPNMASSLSIPFHVSFEPNRKIRLIRPDLKARQSDQPGQKPLGRIPLGQVRLSDSVVSLLHYDHRCVIACLANGRCELIRRRGDKWDFGHIDTIDFGAPHHAIGCSILINKTSQMWCGYR